jgi:D-serine dehydratase
MINKRLIDDLAVVRLGDQILDPLTKGFPGHAGSVRLGDFGTHGWNLLEDALPLPVLTLRRSALEHNIQLMQSYCDANDVLLAPHGKTTMAPQLWEMQLDAGSWGITAASVEQLMVYRHFGVSRVLYANQLAGRANVDYVCREVQQEGWEFYSFVDSPEAVGELVEASRAARSSVPFKAFVEVGFEGGRSGARTLKDLRAVAESVRNSGGRVELVGVAGYESLMPVQREPDKEAEIHAFLRRIGEAGDWLLDEHCLPDHFWITAGGSSTFDHVVEEFKGGWKGAATVILRCGCYITHDHLMYVNSSPMRGGDRTFQPALELWTYVHSCPEPGLALLTFGRRDAPYDSGLPVPIKVSRAGSKTLEPLLGCTVKAMNDQHGYLAVPESVDLRVGDRVVLGISHPCTAFDKWRLIYLVDDSENVVGGVLTFF